MQPEQDTKRPRHLDTIFRLSLSLYNYFVGPACRWHGKACWCSATVGETRRSLRHFIGIILETDDTPKKLFNAAAAVGFRNLAVFYLKRLISNLGMFIARRTYPKKEQEMVRAWFFHVIDGATDELYTDDWTKRTTKEKTGGAMLDEEEEGDG